MVYAGRDNRPFELKLVGPNVMTLDAYSMTLSDGMADAACDND